MKMVKSLLLGSAAGLVAIAGAQAADLPVKAKPVQYVKICSLYGAGFYYIPGTDTCLKIGGYVRAEVNFNANGSFAPFKAVDFDSRSSNTQNWRVRGAATFDARSQTEYGTLRSYLFLSMTDTNSSGAATGNGTGASGYNVLYAPAAFIQFAGFTAGKTGSFFDFDGQPYSNQYGIWSSNKGGGGIELFAYTAQFGNGFSASISAENAAGRRLGITSTGVIAVPGTTYGRQEMPDVVANLRIDQAWGSAQIMGAVHQVITSAGGPSSEVGWAVGGGLKINLPMIGRGDYIIGQATYGKGAMDYVGYGLGTGFTGICNGAVCGVGPVWDAVVVGGGLELTEGWSVTAGFEHFWVPGRWKTSLHGSYGELDYNDAASAVIIAAAPGATAGSQADWSYWQVGSRTVWTPVTNLDLSVEVMYQGLNTAWAGATFEDKTWWSGMFRVQRNFYP